MTVLLCNDFNVRTLFPSNMTPTLFEYKENKSVRCKQLESNAVGVFAVDQTVKRSWATSVSQNGGFVLELLGFLRVLDYGFVRFSAILDVRTLFSSNVTLPPPSNTKKTALNTKSSQNHMLFGFLLLIQ